MPRTDVVKVYRAKGNSDTLAVVIPKAVREKLGLAPGTKLMASADARGRVVFRRI